MFLGCFSQSSAFASKINDPKKFKSRNQILQCKNCGLKSHTIEKCYKLISYPMDYIPITEFNKSNSISGSASFPNDSCSSSDGPSDKADCHVLTNDLYTKLMDLLNEKIFSKDVSGNANMAGITSNNFFSKDKNGLLIQESVKI